MIFKRKDYITDRAYNMTKYLINKGVDPEDALQITISRFITNPKLNIGRLTRKVKKEIKRELFWDDELWY